MVPLFRACVSTTKAMLLVRIARVCRKQPNLMSEDVGVDTRADPGTWVSTRMWPRGRIGTKRTPAPAREFKGLFRQSAKLGAP